MARALLAAGERVVVLDDLSTGDVTGDVTGDAYSVPDDVPLVVGSVGDEALVRRVLRKHRIGGVVHLAAKKSVVQSCADPLLYYRENLGGLLSLLQAMRAESVRRFVFSSGAAVYGIPQTDLVDESAPTRPESPYGRSKLAGEWMVRDTAAAYGMSVVCLRYFNVVGCADPQLADRLGENLFPKVIEQLRAGAPVQVFGGDYPTGDGTCVRDYVHVDDLADAHVAAASLTAEGRCDEVVNVGAGQGHTVLEVLATFAGAAGRPVAHVVSPPRPGDPSAMVADAARAADVLGWRPRHGLESMVESSWKAEVSLTR